MRLKDILNSPSIRWIKKLAPKTDPRPSTKCRLPAHGYGLAYGKAIAAKYRKKFKTKFKKARQRLGYQAAKAEATRSVLLGWQVGEQQQP